MPSSRSRGSKQYLRDRSEAAITLITTGLTLNPRDPPRTPGNPWPLSVRPSHEVQNLLSKQHDDEFRGDFNARGFPRPKLISRRESSQLLALRPNIKKIDWRHGDSIPPYKHIGNRARACQGQLCGITLATSDSCKACQDQKGPFSSCRVVYYPTGKFAFEGACAGCAFGEKAAKCSLRIDRFNTPGPSENFLGMRQILCPGIIPSYTFSTPPHQPRTPRTQTPFAVVVPRREEDFSVSPMPASPTPVRQRHQQTPARSATRNPSRSERAQTPARSTTRNPSRSERIETPARSATRNPSRQQRAQTPGPYAHNPSRPERPQTPGPRARSSSRPERAQTPGPQTMPSSPPAVSRHQRQTRGPTPGSTRNLEQEVSSPIIISSPEMGPSPAPKRQARQRKRAKQKRTASASTLQERAPVQSSVNIASTPAARSSSGSIWQAREPLQYSSNIASTPGARSLSGSIWQERSERRTASCNEWLRRLAPSSSPVPHERGRAQTPFSLTTRGPAYFTDEARANVYVLETTKTVRVVPQSASRTMARGHQDWVDQMESRGTIIHNETDRNRFFS